LKYRQNAQNSAILPINIEQKSSSGTTINWSRDLLEITEIPMPTLNASTSAVFTSTGLDATVIYNTLVSLIGVSVNFGLWLIQVGWPFILISGFVYLMYRLAHKFTGLGR